MVTDEETCEELQKYSEESFVRGHQGNILTRLPCFSL